MTETIPEPPAKRRRTAGLAEGTVMAPLEALQEAAGPPPDLASIAPPGSHLLPSDLVTVLQQLYSAYKVEYWALLEQLRARHTRFAASGKCAMQDGAAPSAVTQPAGAGQPGSSLRELTQSLPERQVARRAAEERAQAAAALAATAAADDDEDAEGRDGMDEDAPPRSQQRQQLAMAGAGGGELSKPPGGKTERQQAALHAAEERYSGAQAAAAELHGYGDEVAGYGSEDEPLGLSDVEDLVLAAPPPVPPPPPQRHPRGAADKAAGGSSAEAAAAAAAATAAAEARFRGALPALVALEQVASATCAALADAHGALACLAGRHGRYLVRRAAVTLGRSTDAKGEVDVDLGREEEDGAAAKVSRLQAQLALEPDGGFVLQNVGRRPMFVNGVLLERGDSAALPHLALVEVGAVRLLFLTNPTAIKRLQARSSSVVM